MIIFSLFLLASCSSPPQQKRAPVTQNTGQQAVPQKSNRIESLLEKAEKSQPPFNYPWLLQAADEYLRGGQEYKAFAIAQQLIPHLQSNIDKTQANLILAEVYIKHQQFEQAYPLLEQLSLQLGFDKRIFAVQSVLYQWSNEPLLAAAALSAEAEFSSSAVQREEKTRLLWGYLMGLNSQQLNPKGKLRRQFKGWLSLATRVKNRAFDGESLNQSIANWQLNNPNHPASETLPSALSNLLNAPTQEVNKISVLLPLSGPQQLLGEAVKRGILFNYWQQQSQLKLTFIDVNQTQQTLADTLLQQQPDLVIGPLTKANVLKLSKLLSPYTVLSLNSVDNLEASPQHFYFSLDASQEAVQAVELISQRKYQKPIVIAQSSRNSRKVAETFTALWKQRHDHQPEEVYFDGKGDMQKTVRDILDVSASVARDKAAKATYKKLVKSETRSRRDIDVIYLVADVTQTRLLKPYIEVNVSPFTDAIPVYATSRSFSKKADSTILRDLNSLSFTDMPWIIDNRNQTAKTQVETLWPDASDNEARLFALGYDAVNLAQQLPRFAQLPYTLYSGKTGDIYLADNNRFVCQRQWAQYKNSKVTTLAMD